LKLHRRRDVALFAAVAAVLVVTLAPVAAGDDVELVPFRDLAEAVMRGQGSDAALSLAEAVANVMLFVPVGAALRLRGIPSTRVALIALGLSAGVELTQYAVVPGRTAAVEDVFLNSIGAVLGAQLVARRRLAPSVESRPTGS
jgi:glycopeptide antibiotics resistance protein